MSQNPRQSSFFKIRAKYRSRKRVYVAIVVCMYYIAKLIFFSWTDFLPVAVLLVKKCYKMGWEDDFSYPVTVWMIWNEFWLIKLAGLWSKMTKKQAQILELDLPPSDWVDRFYSCTYYSGVSKMVENPFWQIPPL